MKKYKIVAFLLASALNLPAADWTDWRGPNREGISTETGLIKSWPESGPEVAWEVESVGVGYSSVSIKDGRIFTQGDLDGVEHIICLNEKDGKLLWAVQPGALAEKLKKQVEDEAARVDKNKDGLIDEFEALDHFGFDFNKSDQAKDADPKKMAEVRAGKIFKKLDRNKDDKLAPEETGRVWSKEFVHIDTSDKSVDVDELVKSRSRALMSAIDQDGDGKISREEVRGSALDASARRIDRKDPKTRKGDDMLSLEEIEKYLKRFEPGKDGFISRAELVRYYTEKHPGKDGMLTLADARAALRQKYGGYRNGQGDGPRGTPVLEGNRVYVEGGNGDVACLDVADGKTIWHINLADLGGRRPGWGYSESPLIEGDLLIVTPGGEKGTVAALNKKTGDVVWQSKDTTQGAHYASPIAANIGEVRQVVQFARSSVFGLSADSGKLLWEYTSANNGTANCSTPLVYKDHVFAASAYGTGGGLARIKSASGSQQSEEVYFEKKMGNHHGGMVRVNDHLYGFGSGGLICMNFMTGDIAWTDRSVGKGSLIVADGMLYLLGEGHQLALAEANPEAYKEHGRIKIENRGRPSWAHPVISNGRLYIRNQEALTAYKIK